MAETIEERFRRLLLLVPYVIRRKEVSVKEICERFGVSRERLIADLNLLFVCGLPGYGPGDLIEAFVDGDQVTIRTADYFSRPLRLTAAEGLLLYSGARALAAAGAGDDALERALAKLEAALGKDAMARVNVEFQQTSDLSVVRESIAKRRRLGLVYYSHHRDEQTEREVDPWALFVSGGRWYFVGWCHLVEDERMFRVDRVRSVEMLDTPAEVPADVDLSKYEDLYLQNATDTNVVLDLAPQAASWVSEYYPLQGQEPLPGGWVRIRMSASGTAWLERLLLRLGTQARVVEPESLGRRVRETACRLARRYR